MDARTVRQVVEFLRNNDCNYAAAIVETRFLEIAELFVHEDEWPEYASLPETIMRIK